MDFFDFLTFLLPHHRTIVRFTAYCVRGYSPQEKEESKKRRRPRQQQIARRRAPRTGARARVVGLGGRGAGAMSNQAILQCTTNFLALERRAAEVQRTPGTMRRKSSGRTMPELRQRATALGLATQGLRKSELLHRIRYPDQFRVVIGSVYVNITSYITIEMLRRIKAGLYLELKHPCSLNLDEWRKRLGFISGVLGSEDVRMINTEIMLVCQHLGSLAGPSRAAWGSFCEGWEVAASRIRGGRWTSPAKVIETGRWTSPSKLTEGGPKKRKMRTPVRMKPLGISNGWANGSAESVKKMRLNRSVLVSP